MINLLRFTLISSVYCQRVLRPQEKYCLRFSFWMSNTALLDSMVVLLISKNMFSYGFTRHNMIMWAQGNWLIIVGSSPINALKIYPILHCFKKNVFLQFDLVFQTFCNTYSPIQNVTRMVISIFVPNPPNKDWCYKNRLKNRCYKDMLQR